ncbi:Rnf-Nqr domain containing protein [Robertkochia aurantiaca]|uniref:Rnf-Nqr domain containing protein n=1 Tax=Robertkochia aurantiaca TaxID=2873700 RepID=UPI001CCF36BE|nr:Rnf-Nqr domain containing protein [Robertkochia sp. 3YJGBD-33]
MRKFRKYLAVFAFLIIILELLLPDYSDLSVRNNLGSYLTLLAMTCVIIAMILSNRAENKSS